MKPYSAYESEPVIDQCNRRLMFGRMNVTLWEWMWRSDVLRSARFTWRQAAQRSAPWAGVHKLYFNVKGKAISVQAQKIPGGWGSQIFKTIGSWSWWGCQPYAPAASTPRKNSCYSSDRLSQPQGRSAARRFTSMKNSSDITGNRTRDLPAYSAVPEPTAPLFYCNLYQVFACCI